jgi:hypothetical protein
MVIISDSESWQRIFQLMADNSRWDLADDDVGRYLSRSYDFIVDLLNRMDGAEPCSLDPAGDKALRIAKRVRRRALRESGKQGVLDEAERYFGMPETRLTFSRKLGEPIYTPLRAASS